MHTSLRAAYEALRREASGLYLREAAARLGVSEMTLLPIAHEGQAVPLQPDFRTIFAALSAWGPLMGLSRNEWVVIETTGPYPEPTFEGPIGVLHSPIIDLRLYLMHWKHVYAVRSFGKDGRPLYSLQFFTAQGEAIHKVYLRESAQVPAWEALVEQLRLEEEPVAAPPSTPKAQATALPERELFLVDWAALRDTHDFYQLLVRHQVSRLQAMQLAEGQYAHPLPTSALEGLLEWARTSETPIMFFVGNAGIHHIYTGSIRNLSPARGWVNILEEVFTLHLNPAGVASVYLVEKPIQEGPIYSVEVFGPAGEEVLWIFGARKPGLAVPEAWLRYVEALRSAATPQA